MSPDQLEAALRAIGAEQYHDKHPFHRRLHAGDLTKDQVRAWALNRYCYQRTIPLKDAAILARMDQVALRRVWRQRIIDHDGDAGDGAEGGLARWLALTDGLGLDRDYVTSMRGALPAARFACEAYVNFVQRRSLLEAIASSLTELFSPGIIRDRVEGMLANYDFVTEDILIYFGHRLDQAPRDADFALDHVTRNATTPWDQQACLDALRFKCGMLWAQLDALYLAYVEPGMIPPGAWRPGEAVSE
ncbi:MAG: pyrroloquinoline-quinone synthase PqqC [Paracoccaceae bacterium]|nr:pyrroloquinoline-quinone synthase PqqC [Paracoccaceae bacterium]